MSQAQLAKYKASFDKFDQNGDGRINKDEIRASLVDMGVKPNEAMVEVRCIVFYIVPKGK